MTALYIILGCLLAVLLFPVFLFIFCWICSLFVNNKKTYDDENRFYRVVLEFSTAVAMKLIRIRIHTKGLEKIPQDSRFVLVCNHRSKFDPIVTWHILRGRQLRFITKPENFKVVIFGAFIRRCCFLPIDRSDARNAIKTINRASDMIKNGQASFGVYPEGTRSKDCVLLPFHSGVFRMAQKADVPLVTVAVSGTEMIHRNYPKRHTDVYFEVIEVTPREEVHKLSTKEMSDRAYSVINETLDSYNNSEDK